MKALSGYFLIARPVLQDPSFRRAVVLVLQHSGDGAFGLVVNHQVEVEGVPFAVFRGGPCESPGLFMLHGHAEWQKPDEPGIVAPGVFLGDAECVKRVTEADLGETLRYRIFAGYAGWGTGQLEKELAAGAWAVVAAQGEIMFDTPVADLWAQLLPSTLPEFSAN